MFKFFGSDHLGVAALEQRWKNVPACQQCWCKFFPSSGKICANFTLFCRKSELCRDFAIFGVTLKA